MRRILVILLLASTVCLTCTKMNQKSVILVTVYPDSKVDRLYLMNSYGDTIQNIAISIDRKFRIEFQNPKEDYYHLGFNNDNQIPLYMKPEEELQITIDSLDINFTGDGSHRNEYLFNKKYEEKNRYKRWYAYQEEIPLELFYRDSCFHLQKQHVKELVNDENFVNRELNNYDYEYAYLLLVRNSDSDPRILRDLEWARSIPIDNSIELGRNKKYIELVALNLFENNKLSLQKLNDVHNAIANENLQDFFVKNITGFSSYLANALRFGKDNYDLASIVQRFVETKSPHLEEHYNWLFDTYEKFHNAKGKSTTFSYEDVRGKIVNLEDFKGNYVYIDFWATWCGWCYKEFPYMDQLKKKYEGRNLKVVSISIDMMDKKTAWKKKIAEKDLKGVQLISPLESKEGHKKTMYVDKDGFDDEFLTLLYVNSHLVGLPHFTLISPEGIVLDACAPRPSSDGISDYLDRYLD